MDLLDFALPKFKVALAFLIAFLNKRSDLLDLSPLWVCRSKVVDETKFDLIERDDGRTFYE